MIYDAIKYLFPGITNEEFRLQDDSDGKGPYIAMWNRPEPKPTMEQINATIATMPPPWKAEVLDEFKLEREKLLNRMMSIAGRKTRAGKPEFAAALDWLAENIIPLDTHPLVLAATSREAMELAFKQGYKQLAIQALMKAPDQATQLEWKAEIDKIFK
jgi:hypothetical protein